MIDSPLSKHHESERLQAYCLNQVEDLSYEKSSKNVSERMGNAGVSAMRLQLMVKEHSEKIKVEQANQIAEQESKIMPTIGFVDIYDKDSTEIVFMSDGVCVSQQKPKRDRIKKESKQRTTTDVMLLQQPDKSYKPIISCTGIDPVKLAYSTQTPPLPIVYISDGATSIKNENKAIFGSSFQLKAKLKKMN